MSSEGGSQPEVLARHLDHWFDLFEQGFALDDVPLARRPFEAVISLLKSEAVQLRFGDDPPLDLSKPWDHVGEVWFRALYTGAEHWYVDRYGAIAMKARGNPPLIGVTLIRSAPFLLKIPMHRNKVEEVGRTAWMYFESGIGPGEDPVKWIVDPPNLDRLDGERRDSDLARLTRICTSLRSINFQLLGAGADSVSAGFKDAVRSYIESAAIRIHSGDRKVLGPAWWDLQMANETSLKLAHVTAFGKYPHTHILSDLLRALEPRGVVLDQSRLSIWPEFGEMSNLRYVQSPSGGIAAAFEGYELTLEIVSAALSLLKPVFSSGAGFLLACPPWLIDPPA